MRLRILSDSEIDALYGRPRFTQEERDEYFSLAPAEKETLKQLRFINARINFILQLGYFKARNMFFVFDAQEVEEDIRFIRGRYFPDLQNGDADITKVTRLKQQKLILNLCNFQNADRAIQKKLEARAAGGDGLRQAWVCLPGADALSGGKAHRCSGVQHHAGYGRCGTGA